ncbi:hypothetical protein G6O67_004732 [Ophiocordyceps sinensis]|uniref:Uncharacterized protein n=1 Tax=Ophiocordyceps sinensis TaxID=72228 RepID=A0A8H4V540_9HYPO|nr:hypothetical protein G6O67_004732 [Ophiocordyceps sinensis]
MRVRTRVWADCVCAKAVVAKEWVAAVELPAGPLHLLLPEKTTSASRTIRYLAVKSSSPDNAPVPSSAGHVQADSIDIMQGRDELQARQRSELATQRYVMHRVARLIAEKTRKYTFIKANQVGRQ